MNRTALYFLALIFACSAISCGRDERLAQFAQESARQQAEQNREMAQLNHEVAQSHQDLIDLQENLEEQREAIDQGRDQLESERREMAQHRYRDPIIAAAIGNLGLILACLAPLALAAYLLYCLRHHEDDQAVSEILIEEIVSEQPVLLTASRKTAVAGEDPPESKLLPDCCSEPR